jgi:hypothetical protein
MLISAPPGIGLPGWMTNFRDQRKISSSSETVPRWSPQVASTRHVSLVNEEIRGKDATHVKIGFNKRQRAHRDVLGGIIRRVYRESPQVAENGEVV